MKIIEEITKDYRNNIQKLYDFYIAAKEGNIKLAAKKANTSSTSVIRSIKYLENKYKIKLIIAHNRGISLTEDGINLYNSLIDFFN